MMLFGGVKRISASMIQSRYCRRRSPRTGALAQDLNLTPEKLMARNKSEAFNVETVVAARQLLADSAEELARLTRIPKEQLTDIDRANLLQAASRHAQIRA